MKTSVCYSRLISIHIDVAYAIIATYTLAPVLKLYGGMLRKEVGL